MAITKFDRGDTRKYSCTYSSGGSPVDITTGYLLLMTFKVSLAALDTDPATVQLTGSVDDGPGGAFSFILGSDISKTMLGSYYWDTQVADGSTPPVVTTIASGRVTVNEDVTIKDV